MRWPQQRGPLSVLRGKNARRGFLLCYYPNIQPSNNGHYFTAEGTKKKVGGREKKRTKQSS